MPDVPSMNELRSLVGADLMRTISDRGLVQDMIDCVNDRSVKRCKKELLVELE